MEVVEEPQEEGKFTFHLPVPEPLGRPVLNIDGVSFAYPLRTAAGEVRQSDRYMHGFGCVSDHDPLAHGENACRDVTETLRLGVSRRVRRARRPRRRPPARRYHVARCCSRTST